MAVFLTIRTVAWLKSSRGFRLRAAVLIAAALILSTCRTENPPELVAQSQRGFALQNGHASEIGLTGSTSGIVSGFLGMPEVYSAAK